MLRGSTGLLAVGAQLGQQLYQGRVFDRFDHVSVEAGLLRQPAVFLLPPAGQRDDGDVSPPRFFAYLSSYLVAVQLRQADVE
jgi:hypothetical protein